MAEAASSEGSHFKVAPSHGWQTDNGCWLEVSVPLYLELSTELLECPCDMGAGFPQSEKFKDERVPVEAVSFL